MTVESYIIDCTVILYFRGGQNEKEYHKAGYSGSSGDCHNGICISLAEVIVVDDTEKPVTYGERLAASFNRGIKSFVTGMGEIFLWLAESWPVLVVLFIIFILPAIILIAVTRKRRKARKNAGRPSGPAA